MSLPFINDTLGNLLNNYVHFITKQMQEIADALWGSENDNEDKLITLPASIHTRGIFCISGYAVSDFSDYPPYASTDFANGNFYELTSVDINYINGNLNISGLNSMGRLGAYSWGNVNASCRDLAESIITEYISNHANDYIFKKDDYPDDPVTYDYSGPNDTIFFLQNNEQHVFETTFPKYDGTYYTSDICNIKFIDLLEKSGEYYVEKTLYVISENVAGRYVSQYGDGLFITKTNDQTFINNYINDNGATHNYTYTYETENGDTITIYYGDNYVITKSDPDAETTYNEYKNALDIIVNKINEDGDYNITVPTYRENKYGPEPEPPVDDDYIDMGLGVETDGMAMYNMAVLTRDELIKLIGDFETNADTGLSFLPHVLGLYKLGIESSQLLTTKSDKINLHKEPGKTAFASNDNYNIVDEQLQVIDCGSITVDREELLTNTYLDFSPYSTYEMFIPGCGWITLPDTVVGRTISVYIVFDLTTCSCKGVVRSEGELLGGSGSTLATVNGIIGSSVPLSINETGLQRGAIMSGAVQTVTALGTSAMGIGIGNPYMGMSGIAMAAGTLAETHIAGNATYTSTKGGATDYSVFGDGYKAVLKITRPKLEIPDNYGHTVGYVVNKYDTLGNYSGFTVCLNPHVTGLTCTSDEKDEIARLLERGVILPTGE